MSGYIIMTQLRTALILYFYCQLSIIMIVDYSFETWCSFERYCMESVPICQKAHRISITKDNQDISFTKWLLFILGIMKKTLRGVHVHLEILN